jgi:carboxypeptidase C (cathepsin A)
METEKGAGEFAPRQVNRFIELESGTLHYSIEAGFLPTFSGGGEQTGNMFYVAYNRIQQSKGSQKRPLSFVFNGGPGSASLMLHMDCLGPRIADLGNGIDPSAAPYFPMNNPDTLLEVSDLVFIDPIGTGYSRALPSVDVKETFWGSEADSKSVCSFIRLYLTRKGGFDAPIYVIGESYGGFRCGMMASHLQDIGIQPTGLVLVSPALNYQELVPLIGNDRPYVHTLPTMACAARHHKKLSQRLLSLETDALYREAKSWAEERYLPALWKGNSLSPEERRAVAEEHASYSGLSADEVLRFDLRVPLDYFAGHLLRGERLFLGVYDARCVARGPIHNFKEDPSLLRAQLPAASAFMDFIANEVGLIRDEEYKFSNGDIHPAWDFTTGVPKTDSGGEGFAGAIDALSRSLRRNPATKVLVASGNYDLMCNRSSSEFAVNHLDVSPEVRERVVLKDYEGGHMFYTTAEVRRRFRRDLGDFYAMDKTEG